MKRGRLFRRARVSGLVLGAALCCAAGVCHALDCVANVAVAALELIEVTEDGAAALDPPACAQATLTAYGAATDLYLKVSDAQPAREEVYHAAP